MAAAPLETAGGTRRYEQLGSWLSGISVCSYYLTKNISINKERGSGRNKSNRNTDKKSKAVSSVTLKLQCHSSRF
jgi:hypothetical protein